MSRFTSDYLPLDRTNALEYTGEIAPNARIKMGVPPEFQNNPDAEEHLNKVRETIVSRYHGKAERALRVFRQDMAVGSVGATERKAKIDDHVFVEYVNQFGREQYTLNIDEGLVREVSEELNPLCLLILHDSNWVTAVPMERVYDGSFDVAYSNESKHSWGDGPQPNAQEQVSDNASVATWGGLNYIDRYGLHPFGVGGGGGGGFEDSIMNAHGDDSSVTVYTQYDDYSFDIVTKEGRRTGGASISQPTAVSSDGERKKKDEDDQRDSGGYGTHTYTYHIMETSLGSGSRHAEPPTIIEKTWAYEKKKVNFYTRQILSSWTEGSGPGGCLGKSAPTPNYDQVESYTDDTTTKWGEELIYHQYSVQEGLWPEAQTWVGKRVETHGPVSFDMAIMFSDPFAYMFGFLTSSGGVGTHYFFVTADEKPAGSTVYYEVGFNWYILNMAPNASNVMSTTFDGLYLYGGGDDWVKLYNDAFCGAHHISTVISYDGPYGNSPARRYRIETSPNKDIDPYYFPYAVDGKPFQAVVERDNDGNVTSARMESPYDVLATGNNSPQFEGWLNLHNGKILVQGGRARFDGDYTRAVYFDGSRKDSVAGIDLSRIATMFLDVPLDWIKKW